MLTRREFSACVLGAGTGLLTTAEFVPEAAAQAPRGQVPEIDLLIRGGTVIDPAQHLNGTFDVAVKDGKILSVAKDIPDSQARNVVSAKGRIVTPGFIDLHVHCFDAIGIGANADHSCLGKGVTTVVDAGSVGYTMIGGFVKYVVKTSSTRIRALVDIGALGTIIGIANVMKNLDWVNPELTAKAAEQNKPAAVGIKVRLQRGIEGENDLECLKRGLKAAEVARLPLMAHIDDPYSPLQESVKMLRKGDIFTHYLNGQPHGVLDANGKILPEVIEARERGVLFDPAQGGGHFSFDVAEKCLAQNFLPDTISTDLTNTSALGPVYDLPTQVSKFMALGIDLEKAIELVTIKPAQIFDYGSQIGTLQPGSEADVSIFEVRDGNFEFVDSGREKRSGRQMLINKAAIRRGQLFVNEN
jgi:dihydroorotase